MNEYPRVEELVTKQTLWIAILNCHAFTTPSRSRESHPISRCYNRESRTLWRLFRIVQGQVVMIGEPESFETRIGNVEQSFHGQRTLAKGG